MSPRLHILLGAGGVGKTTLAAGYALALAQRGARVGLLGIDPARRLQTALGISLTDVETLVPHAGELHAAALGPAESLRRWIAESSPDAASRDRLLANAFFVALAERLATVNDVLAAIRCAEWAEHDPRLTDLVVDTAPGLNAIEFLRRPASIAAFLEGPLVAWLRRLARAEHGLMRGAAQRVLGGLSRLGGTQMLLELGDFLALAEPALERMAVRLAQVQRWIQSESTEILLVTAARNDAAAAAAQIAEALASLQLTPRAAVVNHAIPAALGAELDALAATSLSPEAAAIARYARAQAALTARVVHAVAPLAPAVITLPASRGLDEGGRLAALAALGELLRDGLATAAA